MQRVISIVENPYFGGIMENIQYLPVLPGNDPHIALIAAWYLREWNISTDTTINKINSLPAEGDEFHLLMTLNGLPVATGGLYHRVGLMHRVPHLNAYPNWLALVYTLPEHRGKGLGARLCEHIQDKAKALGLQEIYLFTHTAETLYIRLGWTEVERIELEGKDIAVMKKSL